MNNPHKYNSQVGRTWSRQKGALDRLLKWPKPTDRQKTEINTLTRRLGLSKRDILLQKTILPELDNLLADAKNKGEKT